MANCQHVQLVKNPDVQENAPARMINSQKEKSEGISSFSQSCHTAEPFPSYVASLESRVEKLEKRLAYARLRKASVAMHDCDDPIEAPDRKDSLATIRAAIHGKAARRREAADVNELVSDFGFL